MSVSGVYAFIFLRPPGCLLVRSRVCWNPVDLLPLFLTQPVSSSSNLCLVADLYMPWHQGLPYLMVPELVFRSRASIPGAYWESEHDPTPEGALRDLLCRWGPAPFYSVPSPYLSVYAILLRVFRVFPRGSACATWPCVASSVPRPWASLAVLRALRRAAPHNVCGSTYCTVWPGGGIARMSKAVRLCFAQRCADRVFPI